jgi:hypothetical protein
LKTPILFIIYNRPETVNEVFKVLKKIKPKRLFIASDAPRDWINSDIDNCNKTRKIVENVDWECDVKYNYFTENHGTKFGPAKAIDWFFSEVDEGIILEHDCLPNIDFFDFCSTMLERYRFEEKVMHINGSNFLLNKVNIIHDYYFSKIPLIWGWATWKRAWNKYDVNMKNYQYDKLVLPGNFLMKYMWKKTFNLVFQKKIETWDYQWTYTLFKNNSLVVVPSKNLVSNIGFGDKATFGKNDKSIYSKLKTKKHKVQFHPIDFIWNKKADYFLMKTHFNMNIKTFIKKMMKNIFK